ncbi:MAG: STAS domain-containing protein [Vampirovibrio sp.]|nr:STAS domain-containing protein [Vampirovibrio sp.]
MIVDKEGSDTRLTPDEDLTFENAEKTQQELLTNLADLSGDSVTLDLTKIEHVDSMGLKVIIGLYKTCLDKKVGFQVEASSPGVLRVLQLCGLNKALNVTEV